MNEDFVNLSTDNDNNVAIALRIETDVINPTTTSKRNTDYWIFTEIEVVEEMNRITNETSAVIQYSPSICRALLQHFKWNIETLLERFYETECSDQFFRSAYLYNPTCMVQMSDKRQLCNICCDIKWLKKLSCGNMYCSECWNEYLTFKICSENCSFIQCPEQGCDNVLVDDIILSLILTEDVKVRFKKLQLNAFIESNSALKWCPGIDCKRVVKIMHVEPREIRCDCECTFCFQCSEEWHEPVMCSILKFWLKKCNDDSETSNWINANTKNCPKCQAIIEKDGGCNHLTCKIISCRFEFCWTCLGPWGPHGSGYYSCNRFNDDIAKQARFEQEQSRAALQRYLHYYNRFTNHRNSLKLENKLYVRVATKMKQMQQFNFSWIETQFLKKAVDVLGKSRQTLMYTYVFAYYLEQNNTTKIFEDNQQDLEIATEQLSEFLERDLADVNLVALKQKVQDKFRYVEQRLTLLLKHCAEGYSNNEWAICTELTSN